MADPIRSADLQAHLANPDAWACKCLIRWGVSVQAIDAIRAEAKWAESRARRTAHSGSWWRFAEKLREHARLVRRLLDQQLAEIANDREVV